MRKWLREYNPRTDAEIMGANFDTYGKALVDFQTRRRNLRLSPYADKLRIVTGDRERYLVVIEERK